MVSSDGGFFNLYRRIAATKGETTMASQAKPGFGAGLWRVDVSPEYKLAEVLTIKKSGEKQASEKVTNQDSPRDGAGRVREELMGTIVTSGTIDMTMNFIQTDTTHQAMFDTAQINDGLAHAYELRWYDPATDPGETGAPSFKIAFNAIMFDIPDIDFPLDKAMTLTTKFTVVGDVVYTFPE